MLNREELEETRQETLDELHRIQGFLEGLTDKQILNWQEHYHCEDTLYYVNELQRMMLNGFEDACRNLEIE